MFASILGILLCAIIVGKWGALSYGVIAVFPALIMGELLQRKLGPTLAVFISFFGLIILSLVILIAYAKSIHLTPKEALQQFLQSHSSAIEKILQNSSNPENVEELKKLITVESFPGLLLSSALLLCSLPCIALIRWNPKGFLRRNNIPRDFLRKWKVPDWFVWVALFCGAFLVFDAPIASIVAENIYFSIVIIYFFQGMSILAFFLDSLRLRGPIRVLFYGAGIFFLTPIIVSFGFFDLWFNFRGRKKAEEGEP